ncbi:MAG: hypothetical protein KJT03_13635 [Verrucomicrobiae bacterium]|nr:hypothetical protein [Verrucomicrobiae bacterium]
MQFSKELFWDVNPETIDLEKHARFVIERVLTRGTATDVRELRRTYSKDRIRRELLNCRSLDSKTLTFCSAVYDLEKEAFKCYTTTPSNQKHWNF